MGLRTYSWRMTEPVDLSKPIHVLASNDGHLYEMRNSIFGTLITKAACLRELDRVRSGFKYELPKIPAAILKTVVSFFEYYNRLGNLEVMVYLYWDIDDKKYVLDCPVQTVSPSRIDGEANITNYDTNRFTLVMHIHSHHSMNAYFSCTDDADEMEYRLYGVIGRLDQEEAEMVLRVKVNNSSIHLPLEQIFEEPDLRRTNMSFPEDWIGKVSIIK